MHSHNYFVRESIFWIYLEHETLSSMFNWVDIQWKLNLVSPRKQKKHNNDKLNKKERGEREKTLAGEKELSRKKQTTRMGLT